MLPNMLKPIIDAVNMIIGYQMRLKNKEKVEEN